MSNPAALELIRRNALKRLLLKEPVTDGIKPTHKEETEAEYDADYDADRTYDDPEEDVNLHDDPSEARRRRRGQ